MLFSGQFINYLTVLYTIFLMCPQQMRLRLITQEENHNVIREPENVYTSGKNMAQNFDEHIITKEDVGFRISKSRMPDEPGFDFSNYEIKKLKLWELGVIPYYIDVPSFADKVLRDRIRWFLIKLSSISPLNFMELPRPPKDYNNLRWVFFVNRRGLLGCADHSIKNFTNRGVQQVVLGYDCINNVRGMAAAILAVVGVPAQHNAPDRDEYIEILYKNIRPEKKYFYQKVKDDEWLFHNLSYDFSSAGHVSYFKHSVDGRATFKTKVPLGNINIDDNYGFSNQDILKIKMLYNYLALKINSKESKCSKLFLPKKINDTISTFKDFVHPRQKPHKYIGIDIKTDLPEYMKKFKVTLHKSKNNKKRYTFKYDNESRNEKPRETVQEFVNYKSNNAEERVSLILEKFDPFTQLSDYTTAEENDRYLWKLKEKISKQD